MKDEIYDFKMKLILLMKFFIVNIIVFVFFISGYSQCFKNIDDGLDFIKQNEIQYWAKKNKVKSLHLSVPGHFLPEVATTIKFEYLFDSINYKLKRYRVFFEIDHTIKNDCFNNLDEYLEYTELKELEYVSINPNEEIMSNFNLDKNLTDIYGIRYQFYSDKNNEMRIHYSKSDNYGDTIYLLKSNVNHHPYYYLKYLKLEVKLDDEKGKYEVIRYSYPGDDNANSLQEWNSSTNYFHDTISYLKISKNEYSTLVLEWQRKYTEQNINYQQRILAKGNVKETIYNKKDTLELSAFLQNREKYNGVLSETLSRLLTNQKFSNSIENVTINNKIKVNHNRFLFRSSIVNDEEEYSVITKHHQIHISKNYKPCIVEKQNNEGQLIERYYLPQDSTFKEKGSLVMQLVFNNEHQLIEKIYNRSLFMNPHIKNNQWRKETYEYDLGILIKQTNEVQKSKRDLMGVTNLQKITFKETEVLDYSQQKYFKIHPDDKYKVELMDIWIFWGEHLECRGVFDFKASFYK